MLGSVLFVFSYLFFIFSLTPLRCLNFWSLAGWLYWITFRQSLGASSVYILSVPVLKTSHPSWHIAQFTLTVGCRLILFALCKCIRAHKHMQMQRHLIWTCILSYTETHANVCTPQTHSTCINKGTYQHRANVHTRTLAHKWGGEREPICLEQTKWMHALWESWQMNTVDRTISILETG